MDDRNSLKRRIGCSTITFCHLHLDDALRKIAGHGFTAIDIGINPIHFPHIDPFTWKRNDTDKLSARLAELKLKVSSLNVEPSGLAARYRDEPLEFIESSFAIARALGAYTVTVPPGPATDETHWLESAKGSVFKFRRLADAAEAQGIRLSIEAPHTNTLAENYTQSERLFSLINDPRIGCTFDTSHGQRNDRRPIKEGIAALGAPVVHVHLRDAFWKDCSLTPGQGACDFGPFIKQLVKDGYSGDFNFELESAHADPDEEVRYAKAYLELVIDGNELPVEFARGKDHNAQIRRAVFGILKNPKPFVVAQPSLKKMLKPLARFLSDNTPRFYTRYEMGWRRGFTIGRADRISVKKARHATRKTAKMVRVGILGCGNIGFNMSGAGFARLPNVQLVGVADPNRYAAETTARRLRCTPYYGIEDLIRRAKPDLVANCTKEWVHFDTTMQLLGSGIDVFCEKIMAESLEHGEAMVQRAAENKRILAVNYNWRYLPGIVKIKQLSDSGKLGRLIALRIFCHSWVWNHALDLVEFLGGSAISLSAITRNRDPYFLKNPWKRFADEIFYYPDLYSLAILETAEGVGASITGSAMWNPESCLFNLDAIFEKGILTLSGVRSQDAIGLLSCSDRRVDVKTGLRPKGGPTTFAIAFQRSIENFMEAYLQGKPVPTSGEQGLRIMRMEHAIVESARSGRKISLA